MHNSNKIHDSAQNVIKLPEKGAPKVYIEEDFLKEDINSTVKLPLHEKVKYYDSFNALKGSVIPAHSSKNPFRSEFKNHWGEHLPENEESKNDSPRKTDFMGRDYEPSNNWYPKILNVFFSKKSEESSQSSEFLNSGAKSPVNVKLTKLNPVEAIKSPRANDSSESLRDFNPLLNNSSSVIIKPAGLRRHSQQDFNPIKDFNIDDFI